MKKENDKSEQQSYGEVRGNPTRVLAVDDDASIHQMYDEFFGYDETAELNEMHRILGTDFTEQKHGELSQLQLDHALSGQEGLDKIKTAIDQNAPFSVLYLDVRMPDGWNGIETAERIQEIDPNLKIILISAYMDFDMTEVRKRLGVNVQYLTKPFNHEELRQLTLMLAAQWRQDRDYYLLLEQSNADRKRLDQLGQQLEGANQRLTKANRELEFQEIALDQHAIVSMANSVGEITYVNDKYCEISGYKRGDLLGRNHSLLKTGEHPKEFIETLWNTISFGRTWSGDTKSRNKNGDLYWVHSTIVPFLGDEGPERFVLIQTDISEHKRLERELQIAVNEADLANKAKSEFLATMSHELRTPLTSVLGYSDMLKSTQLDNKQFGLLERVNIAGETLLSLVNDILDLSKVESGNFQINESPCSLRSLLKHVMDILKVRAKDGDVDFQFVSDGEHEAAKWGVIVDKNRLTQVLINLVGNAIKFSPGGRVTLLQKYGEIANNHVPVTVSVTDTGIGMSDAVVGQLFKPFEQADSSISRRFGGTGLGLYISQQLIMLMGSKIQVSSEEGCGSTFEFTLNLELSEQEAKDIDVHRDDVTIPSLQGRVLVVDDTMDIRQLIEGFVAITGAVVETANDGQQAFDQVMGNRYDLILMDMQMPVMNGIEATQLIRQLGNITPIYALTANVMQQHRDEFSAAGCDGFLAKPIEREHLYNVLSQYLSAGSGRVDENAEAVLLAESTQLFRESLAMKLDEIETHQLMEDWEAMGKVVHTLKGGGGTFGYPELTTVSKDIEVALHGQAFSTIPTLVTRLHGVIATIIEVK